jgi:dienelactone hydrolase
VTAAAGWLAQTTGCERIVAIGIGLGGMVAWHAAANGAPIDDLLLWSVPARGSVLVRELTAFARIGGGSPHAVVDPPSDDGALEVGGSVLSAETLAALQQLDLSTLELPNAAARRVLLLGRDTLPVDRHLLAALERGGADVTPAAGVGFGAMMNSPEAAQAPLEVFAQSIAWLAAGAGSSAAAPKPNSKHSVGDSDHLELPVGRPIGRETPLEIDFRGQRMRGVLVEPITHSSSRLPICAVLLNDGASRRIGPNRMWVEAARRWVAIGVPTLRLDVLGIGESDGDETQFRSVDALYRDEVTEQVLTALGALDQRGVADHFFLAGLCSGAYWSFHAARADERVGAIVLINLWSFFWNTDLKRSRHAEHALRLLRAGKLGELRRFAFGAGTTRRALNALAHYARRLLPRRGAGEATNEVDQAFTELHARDVRTLLLLSAEEQLELDLIATGRIDDEDRWPGVALERIPTAQHHFGAPPAQRFVHAALDRALELAVNDVTRAAAPD